VKDGQSPRFKMANQTIDIGRNRFEMVPSFGLAKEEFLHINDEEC
jgi:hypothetical protein